MIDIMTKKCYKYLNDQNSSIDPFLQARLNSERNESTIPCPRQRWCQPSTPPSRMSCPRSPSTMEKRSWIFMRVIYNRLLSRMLAACVVVVVAVSNDWWTRTCAQVILSDNLSFIFICFRHNHPLQRRRILIQVNLLIYYNLFLN